MHQVDAGIRKGHDEAEVIAAVIKTVSLGLNLRDMLEIKSDLTLIKFKIILKGHYKQESTTDLYQRLINISQGPTEFPVPSHGNQGKVAVSVKEERS